MTPLAATVIANAFETCTDAWRKCAADLHTFEALGPVAPRPVPIPPPRPAPEPTVPDAVDRLALVEYLDGQVREIPATFGADFPDLDPRSARIAWQAFAADLILRIADGAFAWRAS